jgi:IS5 family transposase
LRLLLLKHMRNWSYQVLEREVRANLVYRDFTRVGASKAPDAKTMGRWGMALGPEAVEKIHVRVVEIARENQVVKGRKMRVDTTVVETNIHYPTDSNLLGDGVRVLIRAMKRIGGIAGKQGAKLRDRSRSVKLRILEIGRVARTKGGPNRERLQTGIREAVERRRPRGGTGQTLFARDRRRGEMIGGRDAAGRPGRIAKKAGYHRVAGAAGDAANPATDFRRRYACQEAENQIITDYAVYPKRPSDSELVIHALDSHEKRSGCTPRLVAGDAAFYSAKHEAAAHDRGVQ